MSYERSKYVDSKKIKGIEFNFYTSSKPNKKYMAVFVNPKTGRQNTIHFGELPYEHYYDSLSTVYQDLWHLDPKRRRAYQVRHQNDIQKFPSPGYFSYFLLW